MQRSDYMFKSSSSELICYPVTTMKKIALIPMTPKSAKYGINFRDKLSADILRTAKTPIRTTPKKNVKMLLATIC